MDSVQAAGKDKDESQLYQVFSIPADLETLNQRLAEGAKVKSELVINGQLLVRFKVKG